MIDTRKFVLARVVQLCRVIGSPFFWCCRPGVSPEAHTVAAMLHNKVVVVMLDRNEVHLPR